MDQDPKPVLRVENLTKIYPGNVRAVNNISFSVRKGDVIVILGPSGAGKSTLLRCLNRLAAKTEGKVLINNKDITEVKGSELKKLRSDIGMVFQQFNLIPRLSVFENVLAGCLGHMTNPLWFLASVLRQFSNENKQRGFDALKRVGIEHLAPKRADSLSGGQQQRVAIARTLAQDPKVILADEPVASLDPASSKRVLDILKDISMLRDIPVIINLHQIDLARQYATRIIGVKEGNMVFNNNVENFTFDVAKEIYGSRFESALFNCEPKQAAA
jgi:phosphonate transport system ATP-binding protein